MIFARVRYFSIAAGGVTNTIVAPACPDRDAIEFHGVSIVVRPGGENATSGSTGLGILTSSSGGASRFEGKLAQKEWRACTSAAGSAATQLSVVEYFPSFDAEQSSVPDEAQPAVTGV